MAPVVVLLEEEEEEALPLRLRRWEPRNDRRRRMGVLLLLLLLGSCWDREVEEEEGWRFIPPFSPCWDEGSTPSRDWMCSKVVTEEPKKMAPGLKDCFVVVV